MARIIDGKEKNLIGYNVKKFRLEKKLSQQLLSDRLETLGVYICRGSISRIEDKSRTVTDIELYGLSEILGVSITDLFHEYNK
ncbi:MAG: helix-turn-helix transcriptional regulator [Bacillota bacterium]|nr:helix-turn-helix transcriptional regulator [Bacillota bacterium]